MIEVETRCRLIEAKALRISAALRDQHGETVGSGEGLAPI